MGARENFNLEKNMSIVGALHVISLNSEGATINDFIKADCVLGFKELRDKNYLGMIRVDDDLLETFAGYGEIYRLTLGGRLYMEKILNF